MSRTNVKLLEPFDLNGLSLRNRVVMSPMTRARAGKERIPTAIMSEYYAQRASAGLIITEATTISARANGWNESPGIYTEAMIGGWRQVVSLVHAQGGKIFLQLWHCGRVSHSSFHGGEPAVAPSAIKINADYIRTPNGQEPHETPRALRTDEIPGLIEDYRRAAERAKAAGFDGVEIHAAGGYLLDTFLQSKTNHRTDLYGGSIENRYRLLEQVVQAVSKVWTASRVGVKLSPNIGMNDTGSPDFREQYTFVAKQLDRFGLAYLHIMDGLAFGSHELGQPMTLAKFRQVFHGALIGNCGYTQEMAETAIAEGHADMISFGRPFISNPDLVERFTQGWPLAPMSDMNVWYSPTGVKGYTDFSTYKV
ncbi:MAG: alkene reductase [Leptolyngbyaceae cyanobacterium MO_188.B28]|nr:alkene reductase [Leptolyngbyaceae cyanobacterium MO_188.B28]